MNIALATDANYLPLVHIALQSYFDTNSAQVHVHLLSNKVPGEGISQLEEMVQRNGGDFSAYPIDNLAERLGIEVPDTIAMTTYARLFLASILPVDVDKVLYVDCDILFTDDISEFYATDMNDTLVAGVQDLLLSSTYKDYIGITQDEPYLNAGILLIPLKTWREQNMQTKFLDFLLAHNGNVYHHDQGIINAVCAGRKTICLPRYNVISNYFNYPYRILKKTARLHYSEAEYKQASTNPAILHFTGVLSGRPWESICSHPYKDKFDEVKSRTIFKDMPVKHVSFSAIDKLEKSMYHILPFNLYVLFVKGVFFGSRVKHLFDK